MIEQYRHKMSTTTNAVTHTGVGVSVKLGKIWFLENNNLIALERLACYPFSQPTSMLWKDKGFPLPTSRLHGIFTRYWFINPCQTFDAILLSFFFFFLSTITATLPRWLLLNLQHSQHYSHTGKRSAFAKALVLQLQSHHFLPRKCYMFSCYRFHSLYCSHFNPKGQKLHRIYKPANKTPQEADNLWKVTTLVVSEKERRLYKALHRDKPAGNDLPLAWKWKFEGLASKFPLLHCRKFCKRKKKVFKITMKGITKFFWLNAMLEN